MANLTAGLIGVLLMTVTLAGCGSSEEPSVDDTATDAAVQACRSEWKELNADWESRAESGFPSDLSERWTALAAGGAYQAAAADSGCEEPIRVARLNARAVERLSGSLRAFDLVWQYGEINEPAKAWISSARPAAAKRAQGALDRLERFAPLAVADMGAAWQSAVRTDLTDPDAVQQLAESMAFLAGDSRPYRQGSKELRQLQQLISRR